MPFGELENEIRYIYMLQYTFAVHRDPNVMNGSHDHLLVKHQFEERLADGFKSAVCGGGEPYYTTLLPDHEQLKVQPV